METVKFRDPHNKEIQLANGPAAVVGVDDMLVLTFSQATPLIDGTPAGGVSATSYAATVICRIAMAPERFQELVRSVGSLGMANAPAAGNA